MAHNDTYHTRLGGLNQDFQEFKSELKSLLTDLKKKLVLNLKL